MKKIPSLPIAAILMLGALGCGGKDHAIAVTFSGNTAAFSGAQVSDYLFVVTNVPEGGRTLDLDGNGKADQFIFPESCGATMPDNCGYAKGSQDSVTLGAFPLGYRYTIEVRLRDATGATVESGSASFTNTDDLSTLVIPL